MKEHFLTLIFGLALICTSCNNDDDGAIQPDPQGPSEDIVVDQGSVGLVIDTRPIAKKGYEPATAQVDFSGSFSSFSQEVEISRSTNVGTLKIPSDDLTEEQIEALRNGVEVSMTVSDGSTTLATLSNNLKVDNSNAPVMIDTELPTIFPEPNIREDVPYLIQVIDPDLNTHNLLVRLHIDRAFEPNIDPMVLDIWKESVGREYYEFYFESAGDGAYYMKFQDPEDEQQYYYLEMSDPGNLYTFYKTDQSQLDGDKFKFRVARDEQGHLTLTPLSGNTLYQSDEPSTPNQSYQLVRYGDGENYLPFRIVAANIEWEVEDRGTEYNAPILPPAKLDFAFRSILRNCSGATLTETVGRSESQTKSYTMGTEESIELFSSSEFSLDVTAGVETEASFFGSGVTASMEVSTGFTYTTSSTTSSSRTWEETVEETVEVSREREVEIPEFTEVEVYDAIQTLEDVTIPFVKILRVSGSYDGTDPLTGEEVSTQLLANQFGGVVSEISDDYVEISIRGNVVIDKLFEVESNVTELEGSCTN